MWTLDDALPLIREIQAEIRPFNYHLLLGGGVLNEGHSTKDLDLFFVPLNNAEPNDQALLRYLFVRLTYLGAIRDAPDYGAGNTWRWATMEKFSLEGKRIDVFIQ